MKAIYLTSLENSFFHPLSRVRLVPSGISLKSMARFFSVCGQPILPLRLDYRIGAVCLSYADPTRGQTEAVCSRMALLRWRYEPYGMMMALQTNSEEQHPARFTRSAPKPGPRERLMAGAGLLFAKQGPDSVTIREIAAAAKVQLSDIYRHFPDKDALYLEVCRSLFHDQALRAEAALRSETTPARKLFSFAVTLYRDLLDDGRFIPILVRELLGRDAAGVAQLADGAFRRQFSLVVECVRALGHEETAEPTAYSFFVLALGHVQMMPFGRAVPVRGFKWDDPVAMARLILAILVPTTDWSKIRLRRSQDWKGEVVHSPKIATGSA